MRLLAGVVFAHLVACYHPNTIDCTVQCSAATECTGSQSCKGGWCAGPSVTCDHDGNPIQVDAADADGAPPTDADQSAQKLCAQGCTKGTCDSAGVCVIDCSATGTCLTDVTCPTNLPCRVLCGSGSCTHHVFCQYSTSCEVQCQGTNACGDEIQCPVGVCDVQCLGQGSCKRRTRCALSCSCDVTCSGTSSCPEASECPLFACKVGNGCSSIPTGCNTCN